MTVRYIEESRASLKARAPLAPEDMPPRMIPLVTCDCGREIECRDFTNTCECGADYNFSGQRLAPRSQWGEETGEHWTDCY